MAVNIIHKTVVNKDPLFTLLIFIDLLGAKTYIIFSVKYMTTIDTGHLIKLNILTLLSEIIFILGNSDNINKNLPPTINIITRNTNKNNKIIVITKDLSKFLYILPLTLYILEATMIIELVPQDIKYKAHINKNTIFISNALPENNGITSSLVLAGRDCCRKLIKLSIEKENVLAAIPINKIIGTAESRKKKARFPDKTDTTGFLISLNISIQNSLKF